jgi:hypothetical protein
MAGVGKQSVWLALVALVALSGCAVQPEPQVRVETVTVTETYTPPVSPPASTPSPSTTSIPSQPPAFPVLKYDTKSNGDGGLLLFYHDGGPCINPREFLWEIVQDDGDIHEVAKITAYDRWSDGESEGSSQGGERNPWCIHQFGGFSSNEDRPDLVRAYNRTSGTLVFLYDFPVWPIPRHTAVLNRDDATDRLGVTSADAMQWTEFQLSLSKAGKFGYNEAPTTSLATNQWKTIQEGYVQAGDYLQFCVTSPGSASVVIRYASDGAIMGTYNFNDIATCP